MKINTLTELRKIVDDGPPMIEFLEAWLDLVRHHVELLQAGVYEYELKPVEGMIGVDEVVIDEQV